MRKSDCSSQFAAAPDECVNMILQWVALGELAIGWALLAVAFVRSRPWTRLLRSESQTPVAPWGFVLILIGISFIVVPIAPSGFAKSVLALKAAILLCPVSIVIDIAAIITTSRERWVPDGESRPVLPRTGIYRSIRHPVYTSLFCLAIATATARTWWPLMVPGFFFLMLGIELRATADDFGLANVFQNEFEEYQSVTRAYLPRIR